MPGKFYAPGWINRESSSGNIAPRISSTVSAKYLEIPPPSLHSPHAVGNVIQIIKDACRKVARKEDTSLKKFGHRMRVIQFY